MINNKRSNPGTLISAAYSGSTFVLQAVFQNTTPRYPVSPLRFVFICWRVGDWGVFCRSVYCLYSTAGEPPNQSDRASTQPPTLIRCKTNRDSSSFG